MRSPYRVVIPTLVQATASSANNSGAPHTLAHSRRKMLHHGLSRILLIIAGFLLNISIPWTAGITALIVGVAVTAMGSAGHAIGGRRTYY
jgi:hypothetical protein